MKRNNIYVLNQPRHPILGVIVLGSDYPLSEEYHTSLLNLTKASDVIFVFPSSTNIQPLKFTSLYSACGYIEAENTIETVEKVLKYDQAIFEGKHYGFTLSIQPENYNISQLLSLLASSIAKPIFKARQMTSEEMYESYKKVQRWYGSGYDEAGMYQSCIVESKVMFFKHPIRDIILDGFKTRRDWIKTFSDPITTIATLFDVLGVDRLDMDYETVRI